MGCGASCKAVGCRRNNELTTDQMLCPFLSAMVINGLLKPDSEGNVTGPELQETFRRTGVPDDLQRAFMSRYRNEPLSLFNNTSEPPMHMSCVGRIRDPERWALFARFRCDGQFDQNSIVAACKHFDSSSSSSSLHVTYILETFFGVFTMFRARGQMYVKAMRDLVLDGKFPPGYTLKRTLCAKSLVTEEDPVSGSKSRSSEKPSLQLQPLF